MILKRIQNYQENLELQMDQGISFAVVIKLICPILLSILMLKTNMTANFPLDLTLNIFFLKK